MILTRTPYIPPGRFIASCCFPMPANERRQELINEALEFLGLWHILERSETDPLWHETMSPGEAQRFAFVRVFVHMPRFLFLDEATTSITPGLEERIFSRLIDRGVTFLTATHNQALRTFHKYSMELDGAGSYSLWENETGKELNIPDLEQSLSSDFEELALYESSEQVVL
jgi:putative ATP-binding cassette transporter